MRVVDLPEIRAVLDVDAAFSAVEDAIRRFAAGEAEQAAVGHLHFADPPGDVHVKSAWLKGDSVFVVKLASTFYANPARGLAPGAGLMLVASAETGSPVALLHDRGALTDLRTAMAGAVAARALADPAWAQPCLGVVGTGVQAELQARWIAKVLQPGRIRIWGRRPERADALTSRLADLGVDVQAVSSVADLAGEADLIVTTTPARAPVLELPMLRPGYRIVAVGADAPGKRELGPGVVAKADVVLADSHEQACDHGECASARADGLKVERVAQLGAFLSQGRGLDRAASAVADLTGLGVQDVAIARAIWDRLAAKGEGVTR